MRRMHRDDWKAMKTQMSHTLIGSSRFIEGFGTADLQEGKIRLEELRLAVR